MNFTLIIFTFLLTNSSGGGASTQTTVISFKTMELCQSASAKINSKSNPDYWKWDMKEIRSFCVENGSNTK
tara:strand:- start:569 stop:781 length:213 start_codon:yes stop_codon:yes gene_type:complete